MYYAGVPWLRTGVWFVSVVGMAIVHTAFRYSASFFETVEGEIIGDAKWLAEVLLSYQANGFLTAIASVAPLALQPA